MDLKLASISGSFDTFHFFPQEKLSDVGVHVWVDRSVEVDQGPKGPHSLGRGLVN